MKQFHANIIHRGCSFDVRFCAKNMSDAAKRIDVNYYFIKKYVGSGNPIAEPFTEIMATPYGSNSVEIIGHRNEMIFDDAKKIINTHLDKKLDKYLSKIKS